MGETFFTPEDIECLTILANESHQIGIRVRDEIDDLHMRQERLNKYASETVSLSEEVGKLSELIGLMYSILGVPIRDSDGRLRDVADVSYDLCSLNPKIVLSFQELMQF